MVEQALGWLSGLPPVALYLALAVAAAIENIFPPIPADTVVAFGAFLAARGDATPAGTMLATWLGNVGGAMLVYATARRFGAGWLSARLRRFGGTDQQDRLLRMYERRGMAALFFSRFLPGVRALVPPVAGALRLPVASTTLAIAVASALWYGTITWVAYRVGADWELLQERIGSLSRTTALVAVAIVLVAAVVWFVVRSRRRKASP